MRKHLIISLMMFAALLGTFIWLAPPTLASDGTCIASPSSGSPGTVFSLSASGFDPNTPVWLYAVEPNGTAFSDPEFNAFGGSAQANEKGVVTFPFITRYAVYDVTIARALGTWTLVVQQLGPNGTTVHQANCLVTLRGKDAGLSGALLSASPSVATLGTNVSFTGSGFAPDEYVNLWVTPPPNCGGFAFSLPDLLYQYSAADAFKQDDVKTNSLGRFEYLLPTYSFYHCPGSWALSAFAPGSKMGAIARFTLAARGVPGGATLTVNPASGYSRGSTFTFSGSGFAASGLASCWLTRPEGTVKPTGDYTTNASGLFTFKFATGFDLEEDFDGDLVVEHMHYSEGSLGVYAMTCRDNSTGATATAWFSLNGLNANP